MRLFDEFDRLHRITDEVNGLSRIVEDAMPSASVISAVQAALDDVAKLDRHLRLDDAVSAAMRHATRGW